MPEELKELNITIKPIDRNAPGFMPMYRKVLAVKRAFTNPDKAQPEDIDEVMLLLEQHITAPADPMEKRRILDLASAAQITQILDAILGAGIVPPANGGA